VGDRDSQQLLLKFPCLLHDISGVNILPIPCESREVCGPDDPWRRRTDSSLDIPCDPLGRVGSPSTLESIPLQSEHVCVREGFHTNVVGKGSLIEDSWSDVWGFEQLGSGLLPGWAGIPFQKPFEQGIQEAGFVLRASFATSLSFADRVVAAEMVGTVEGVLCANGVTPPQPSSSQIVVDTVSRSGLLSVQVRDVLRMDAAVNSAAGDVIGDILLSRNGAVQTLSSLSGEERTRRHIGWVWFCLDRGIPFS
jgi:hypothetical protein